MKAGIAITKAEFMKALAVTRQFAPVVLPRGWARLEISPSSPLYGLVPYIRGDGLRVLFSADPLLQAGKTWLHVSMSYEDKLPSYEDMKMVKQIFIGPKMQALQVFPADDRHINIHNYCLHLWACVEGDGLPDFGKEGMI